MISLVDAYNKIDFVRRYQKAISTADITMVDIDDYLIKLKYKGNTITISFRKDRFLWFWKVVCLEPNYRVFADYYISYFSEIVFADKLCDLFCDKFQELKGGDWYEEDVIAKPNVYCGFIERSMCERYICLDKGDISRRSLRIVY